MQNTMADKVTWWHKMCVFTTLTSIVLFIVFIICTVSMWFFDPGLSTIFGTVRSISIASALIAMAFLFLEEVVFSRLVIKHWHRYIDALYRGSVFANINDTPTRYNMQPVALSEFMVLLGREDAKVLFYEERLGTGYFSLPLMDKASPWKRRLHNYIFPIELGRNKVEDAVVGKLLQSIGAHSKNSTVIIKDPYKVVFNDHLENSVDYAGPPVTNII